MDVEAHGLNIDNILKKGQFLIPDYQREFDWDKDELDEFLDDILELDSKEPYFIGHMVFDGKFTSNVFNVIDGQQRMTTITILLCVVRDILFSLNEEQLASGLNQYIFQRDKNNEEFAILKNEMPYPLLQKYVQSIPSEKDIRLVGRNSGEKKIKDAYDFYKNKLNKLDKDECIDLRDKILGLEVIFVAAGGSVDAHSIFMTLNATGKNLTAFDLIKNQVFSKYPASCHVKEPNDTWIKIINNIRGNERKSTEVKELKFLNKFWASRHKKVSNHKLFKEFNSEIIKKNYDIKLFLHELLSDSKIYNKIIYPELSDWKDTQHNSYRIFYSLNAINTVFNVEVANSFLLALLRDYYQKQISNKVFADCLQALEKFHFIFNAICSNRSSGLDQFYSMYARKLLEAKDKEEKHLVIKNLIKGIDEKTPDFDKFKASFTKVMKYSKLSSKRSTKDRRLIEYLLKRIEAKNTKFKFNSLGLDLEHIYPERPNVKDWPEKLDIEVISSIGNILLLDNETNNKIGNSGFNKKREIILKDSPIVTSREFLKSIKNWNVEQIKIRQDSLCNTAYSDLWEK